MSFKISSMLDNVANSLQKKGLIKEAYELDKIADALDTPNIFWKYVGKPIRPGVIPMIGEEKPDRLKGRTYAIEYYGETSRHPQGRQPSNVTNIKVIFDKNKDPDITEEKAGLKEIGYSHQTGKREGYRYKGIDFLLNDELPGKLSEETNIDKIADALEKISMNTGRIESKLLIPSEVIKNKIGLIPEGRYVNIGQFFFFNEETLIDSSMGPIEDLQGFLLYCSDDSQVHFDKETKTFYMRVPSSTTDAIKKILESKHIKSHVPTASPEAHS